MRFTENSEDVQKVHISAVKIVTYMATSSQDSTRCYNLIYPTYVKLFFNFTAPDEKLATPIDCICTRVEKILSLCFLYAELSNFCRQTDAIEFGYTHLLKTVKGRFDYECTVNEVFYHPETKDIDYKVNICRNLSQD